ncbi:MAG: OB-fold nucleic acid binding domain-containing protein, partial [Methanomassiliicoccales archaeon]
MADLSLSDNFTHISDIFRDGKVGSEYLVRGWIYRTRSSGSIVFAVLRDSTGILQCTVRKTSVSE